MSMLRTVFRYRWFVLGVLFLIVNTITVLPRAADLRCQKVLKPAMIAPQASFLQSWHENAVWRFPSDMAAAEAIGKWEASGPVRFSPEIKGAFCWRQPNELVFQPQTKWPACSVFTARFKDGLRALDGNPIDARETYLIKTSSLDFGRVNQIEYMPGGTAKIRVEFNSAVVMNELAEHLVVFDPVRNTNINYAIESFGGECTEAVIGITNAPPNDIEIRVKPGLTIEQSSLPLQAEIRRTCVLKGELTVNSVEPQEHDSFAPPFVVVDFSMPVETANLAEYVRLDPQMKVTFEPFNRYYYYGNGDGNSVKITGDFKPGGRYAISLLKGLPAKNGTRLTANSRHNIYFEDATRGLRPTAEGTYMSPYGNMLLPFEAINVTNCHVSLVRVFPNNLTIFAGSQEKSRYYGRYREDELGCEVASKDIPIKTPKNQAGKHAVYLRELTGGKPGAYLVSFGVNGDSIPDDDYHLVISDIGLIVKTENGSAFVWANSLHTLAPLSNATIRIYSGKNQELASGLTDTQGIVRLSFGTNNLAAVGSPSLVVAENGDDVTYLALASSAVEPHDCGKTATGEYLGQGYEAFLFTDRGIYRPGETARLKAIVRGRDAKCPEPFPVVMKVRGPDEKLLAHYNGLLNDLGSVEFAVEWPDFALTGRYKFELAAGGNATPFGTVSALLEEFAPPQIKVAINTDTNRCPDDTALAFEVSAMHLFGKPAAGLSVDAEVEFKPLEFAPQVWLGFSFGDAQKQFKVAHDKRPARALDENGSAKFETTVPDDLQPPAAMRAIFIGTVAETGGRTVSAYASRPIDVYPFYIGIRGGKRVVEVGREHSFDVAAVLPDESLKTTAPQLEYVVEKIIWISVMKQGRHNSWAYESEPQASKITDGKLTPVEGRGAVRFTPDDWGRYRLTVRDPESGSSSSVEFDAGDTGQAWSDRSMEEPERVDIRPDRESYVAGDTARLLMQLPFAGKALVTVESTNVLTTEILSVTGNTVEVEIPILPEYVPGIHCSVSVIKPAVSEKMWTPHRAIGRVAMKVEAPERKLTVKLAAPASIRPQQKLDVQIETLDAQGKGAPAEVVMAAVDEGICMLTAFKTPDPYAFFFDMRRTTVSHHDLYAMLTPELDEHLAGEESAPGGGDPGTMGRRLNPVKTRRFKPVALWVDSFRTGADGKTVVSVEVPEFIGQLRLMAVAIDRERFGCGQASVQVKRPLIVQSSLPRFLAPADRVEMPIHIFNETGTNGEVVVTVSCNGPLTGANGEKSLARRVSLKKDEQAGIEIPMKALDIPGPATCRVEVAMGPEHFADEIELPVRPAASWTTVSGSGQAAPGSTTTLSIPVDWLEGTGSNDLCVSALPSVELGGGLNYLLNYPYGCLEQTTSKSFPLLYLADLAEQLYPGWLTREQVTRFVRAGIMRVLSMQKYDGSFSLWPGCDTYPWGSIYATHFLAEAKKAGYDVPEERLDSATDYLLRSVVQARHDGTVPHSTYDRAYGAFVLALAGRPQHGVVGRLRELPAVELDRGTRTHIAGALIAAGLRREGHDFIGAMPVFDGISTNREIGGSLYSGVRDDALLLATFVDSEPDSAAIPALVKRLNAAKVQGRWYNTQENALALMAMGKYCRLSQTNRMPISGSATWNGDSKTAAFDDKENARICLQDQRSANVVLRNTGKGSIYYCWRSQGVPLVAPVQEEANKVRVVREFLDRNGAPVTNNVFVQGRLYVVHLSIEDRVGGLDNIVIEDLLPGGLEIENTSLKTSEILSWVKDRKQLQPLHTDIRDDRLVLFTGEFSGTQEFFYTARAVSKGTFILPAVTAECMYDPEIHSRIGRGIVKVVQGEK